MSMDAQLAGSNTVALDFDDPEPNRKDSDKTTTQAMILLEQKVDAIWQQYDHNGSGVLEEDEAKEFLRASLKKLTGGDPTDENVDKTFNEIDKNGNKVLERDEVLQFLQEYA